jgi:hypothetical protein
LPGFGERLGLGAEPLPNHHFGLLVRHISPPPRALTIEKVDTGALAQAHNTETTCHQNARKSRIACHLLTGTFPEQLDI